MPTRMLSTAEDRRADVVSAALAAFAARGYFGTTTTEIAADAGISQAYLYRLFENKEALFIAVLASVKERIDVRLDRALVGLAPRDAERALLGQRIDDEREAALLLQAVAACSVPVIASAVRDCYREQWRRLHDLGVNDGAIRDYLAGSQFSTSVRLARFPEGDAAGEALRSR